MQEVPSLKELVEAAKTREPAAMNALISEAGPMVYKFALRMCRNEQDAEEIAQETLLSLFKSIETFRGEASASSWIYSIARNACLKKYRRREKEPAHHEPLTGLKEEHQISLGDNRHERPQDSATDLKRTECALGRILMELEDPLREVFVLRELEGLSAEETAEILSLSVPALKSRLHRARKSIQERLESALSLRENGAGANLLATCQQIRNFASVSDAVQSHICERIRACLLI